MALLNSLYTGVSGLRSHQSMMDVIGNNIANINTIGFKGSRMTFSDTFYSFTRTGTNPTESMGGTNSYQIGLGVKTNSIDRFWTQGTIQNTGVTTDLALQGPGMFVVKSFGEQAYTRSGSFTFDADGKLVNPQNGAIVQGKMANAAGAIPPGNNLDDIQVDINEKLPAEATSQIQWGGNLDSNSKLTRTELVKQIGNINSGEAGPFEYDSTIYNEFGDPYTFRLSYAKTAANQYDLSYEVLNTDGNALSPAQTGTIGTVNFVEATAGSGDYQLDAASKALFDSADPSYFGGISIPELNLDFTVDPTTVTQKSEQTSLTALVDENREPNVVSGTITIYDSLGTAHQVTLQFTKTDSNQWNFRATVPGSSTYDGNEVQYNGSVSFNSDGSLDLTNMIPSNPVLSFSPDGGANPLEISLDFGKDLKGISQTNGASVLSALSQDGSPAANLTNLNIDQYGYIQGVFSNGKTKNLAQIMVATFTNENGLIGSGDNLFKAYANAGQARIAAMGEESGTVVQSGALEMSNVDLSEEFTKMIQSQRGFQANARVITTSDSLLQELTNLIR